MKKEEILEKSRMEGHSDEEWETAVENRARRFGSFGFGAAMCTLLIFNMTKGIDNTALFIIFNAYFVGWSVGRYTARKKKSDLILTVLFAIGVVFQCVSYVQMMW